VLVPCPVIGIGKPKRRPILAVRKKFTQLFDKRLLPSKKLDEPLGIMGYSKSVVPRIPFHKIFGKDVDSFFLGYLDKSAVFGFRVKKGCLFVPKVPVKL